MFKKIRVLYTCSLVAFALLKLSSSAFAQELTYDYDVHGRLVTVSSSSLGSTHYSYDAANNRTSVIMGGAPLPPPPPPPPNGAPIAVDDATTVFPYDQVLLSVLQNDSDPDGHSLTIVGVTAPERGSAAIGPGGTYVVFNAPEHGAPVTFQYTISDGNGGQASASVTIYFHETIEPPPPPPGCDIFSQHPCEVQH